MFKSVFGLLIIAALLAIVLFSTGFWTADVEDGALPKVDVSAMGGEAPSVDFDSKKLVVGTKEAEITLPKVSTEKKTVRVPVIGVKPEERE